ncbi:MAG: T9SS type A sorting domain-containing protein [Bacteroidota bacterium]
MRQTVYLLTLFLGFSISLRSQNYAVGHQTITFIDSARGNRPVPSEIYYAATVAGESTPVAAGLFPVIVFGHGFQMAYDSYFYFRDAMVPAGYILVFPKTETSLSPNHAAYGADLAFLVVQMKVQGANPASPFYQHVDSTSAIMGHSMGGGASFLACRNNTVPTVMVTLAAAETSPSAIAAARNITIPSLVFSADMDCVSPPATNQLPMYDSLASGCKNFINIKGGGHCYFADANFICSLGEIGCPAFTITRDQQHATTLDFTKPYLAFYLKKQANAWTVFNDSLNGSARITFQQSCTTTAVTPGGSPEMAVMYPNPAGDITVMTGNCKAKEAIFVTVSDIQGRKVFAVTWVPDDNHFRLALDMKSWERGIYLAEIRTSTTTGVNRIVKK